MYNVKQPENVNWEEKFAPKGTEFYNKVVCSLGANGERLFFAENKEVVFKVLEGDTLRELSNLLGSRRVKEEYEGGKMYKKVLNILQFMCIKFAGRDLWIPDGNGKFKEAMKEHERKTWISSHYETDVLTAYILLHISAKGEITTLMVNNNDKEVPVEFDLNQVEFIGSDNIEDALFHYKLKRKINIRGKQISEMVIGPATFRQVSEIPFSGELEKTNFDIIATLAESIYYLPELSNDRVYITSQELNRLHFMDITAIKKELAKRHIGINMIVEFEDKDLQQKFKSYLPWYDTDFLL